ncbi:MAG: hypothetical protein D3924_17815 [Candidatus Electrothrix sp. AR4]|nr:hypothetical protein [Candidatus Electrothrix sp. AR4]
MNGVVKRSEQTKYASELLHIFLDKICKEKSMDNPNEAQFEIKASSASALQYISLGIIVLILVNILATIVRIQSGILLIQFIGTKTPSRNFTNNKLY